MTNVTVSAMISHLDSLVLAYIQRRSKMSVPKTSPFHATEDTANDATEGSLTLERIYSFYLGFNGFPSDLSTPKLENIKGDAEAMGPMPLLPVEIVEQVFEFCAAKELPPLRLLSRRMNDVVITRTCRAHSQLATLNKIAKIENFIEFFEKKIVGLGSVFGAYSFGVPCKSVLHVISVVGPSLKYAQFEAKNFDAKILTQIPNVEVLRFVGLPNVGKDVLTETSKLMKLKRLTLHTESPGRDSRHVTEEYLHIWLQLAPNLREFKSTIQGTRHPLSQILDLCRSHRHLYKVSWEDHLLIWKNGEMEVRLWGSFNGEEPLISIFNAIRTHSLPPLTHVTINNCASYADFGNFVFETVRCLSLSDYHWVYGSQFHINFPRLNSLHLDGYLYPGNVQYFASNFVEVSTLKLSGYYISSSPHRMPILEEESEWPFSKLTKLKRLEFETSCTDSLRQTVLSVVRLTLQRAICPLDQLIITHSPRYAALVEVEAVKSLFYSMHQLNYHKHFKFTTSTSMSYNI